MVRLLLDSGAAVNDRDDSGETALDWALRLGETESSRMLRKAGARQTGRPVALPPGVPTPRSVRAAMEHALARLQAADVAFSRRTRCISCHNQSLPAVAVTLADAKGVRIDRTAAGASTQATLGVWARSREDMMIGNCSVFGFLGNATYGLFALAEENVTQRPETDAVVSCLRGLQRPDGSWEGGDTRPPLAGRKPLVYTSLAVRGLKTYSPPGQSADAAARIARAREFLRRAVPADTQDTAFKLLGLRWAGAPQREVANEATRLLAMQRRDGGWGQLPTLASDAYATGQALHALCASGAGPLSRQYRNGVQYLLRTQLGDATWYVRSRAIGFQPYFDAGFPHGRDQFISAAATSWAVIALSCAL
jgi:hypothetical protein